MRRTTSRPPVLLLGMHRSGTSMIARMLDDLGLFLGWRKQGDHEALFFLALNEWLLTQCGGNWDQPGAIRNLIRNPEVRPLVTDYLRLSLRSPRCISFLGPARYLRFRSPLELPIAWGWKDPRTTFTLPIWLELFPRAKVVHVMRHGVDVAQSLRSRHELILARRRARYARMKPLYLVRAKESGFSTSLRCASLEDAFVLWEDHLREAEARVRELGERALEIRYEDFLANAGESLGKLAEFCELAPTADAVAALASRVRADRAFAHRKSPALAAFASRNAERLAAHGY